MAERQRTSATERVPCQQSYSRIREVEDGVDHWEEAIGVGEGVGISLVLIDTCAPELGIVPTSDHSTFCTGTHSSLDVVEGLDDFVADQFVQPIFVAPLEGDDEDLLAAFQRKVDEWRDLIFWHLRMHS